MVVSREGWYQLAYMLQVWETTVSGYAITYSLYEGEVTKEVRHQTGDF